MVRTRTSEPVLESGCRESPRDPLGSALLADAALVFATARAVRIPWLADDSFVSFRYAWNLVHGHGLVYNAGERVEGYSNLLWTLLMAGGMAIGVTPEVASKALGILCWLILGGLLALAVQFVPIEQALQVARRRIAQASPDEAQAIDEFLERYYFRSAGPNKQALADEVKDAVKARRARKPAT